MASAGAKPSGRLPQQDAALHVVKGGIVSVFGLPTARSTKNIKCDAKKTTITVGPLAAAPTDLQLEELQNYINAKIAEDANFEVIKVSRSRAEDQFGDSVFDEFGVPRHVATLRLVRLKEWNINANAFPVVQSTGLIGDIAITAAKFKEDKQLVEFTVKVELRADAAAALLAEEKTLDDDAPLWPLAECLPPTEGASMQSGQTTTEGGQVVTPWEVAGDKDGAVDYDKLLVKFGCSSITPTVIDRIARLTAVKPHHLLTRGMFFSHRDLDELLNAYEKGVPFYLYTGRGPSSSSLHVGHLVPFTFTRWLQKAFKVPLVIQLTDDEKFLFKDKLSIESAHKMAFENARDIIAMGFDRDLTFIFSNLDYIQTMYPLILEIQKKITYSQSVGAFGFTPSDNVGKSAYPAVQAAPSFARCFPTIFPDCKVDSTPLLSAPPPPPAAVAPLGHHSSVRCLIPQAIDQDPFFRVTRDVAPRLGLVKPALIHSKFIPALQGSKTKMSGSVMESSIYVNDTPEQIKKKIFQYAFSGGKATIEEQKKHGADLSVDVAYQYLSFFMDDEERFQQIGRDYASGKLMTGEVKQVLVDLLSEMNTAHMARRALVTDEEVRHFMNPNRPELVQRHAK
eukprot:Selendium_serpulae@DN5403_c0_g1_i2.p1